MCMLLISRVQASYSPPVHIISPPTSQGYSSSLCQTLGPGFPILGSNYSLPREDPYLSNPFPLNPFPGHMYLPDNFSFLPTQFHFLYPYLYRSCSTSLQLVFSENSSTCKCIFDVFVGGGEFYILLLCRLDLSKNRKIFKLNFGVHIIIFWVIPCSVTLRYSGFGPQLSLDVIRDGKWIS